MEFHMINITYAALHMHAQTEKTTKFLKGAKRERSLDIDNRDQAHLCQYEIL